MTQQTSLLVQRQLPGFVREDHPQFIEFLKAYYRFLENPLNEYKEIKYITDVDYPLTVERYDDLHHNTYANLLPKEYATYHSFLIKNIVPLYLSKGSERSFRFLFRLLYDEEIGIKYLRDNILYTSASKWVKENSLNISARITSKYVSDGKTKEFYLVDYVSEKDVEVFINGDVLPNTNFGVSDSYRKLVLDTEPSVLITGNVSFQKSTYTLTGNGTSFLYDLKVGDNIIVDDQIKSIVDISSNTTLNVNTIFTSTSSNQPLLRQSKIEVKYEIIDKNILLSRKVIGAESNASCIIERTSFELVNNRETVKLFLNAKTLNGKYVIGEKLYTNIFVNNVLVDVELKTISELRTIKVIDGGADYNVGDPALIIAPGAARNPVAVVKRVFLPVIESIKILDGGCGFTPGYNVTVNGFNYPIANVKIADTFIDPYTKNTANTFVVYSDVISDIDPANTLISSPSYGLSGSELGNINSNIYTCFSETQYTGIGEIISIDVGDIFLRFYEKPTLDALPTEIEIPNVGFTVVNTKVAIDSYGSLGKIVIRNRGSGYSIGDEVKFTNKTMNLGIGAEAEVTEITSLGELLKVSFVPTKISGTANVDITLSDVFVEGTNTLFTKEVKVGDRLMINQETRTVADVSSDTTLNVTSGFSESFVNKRVRSYERYAVGGQGYSQDKLPDVEIISSTGSGGIIAVTAIMGSGDLFDANTTPLVDPVTGRLRKIGEIQEFQILDSGEGFTTIPLIDMTNYGSGNAISEAVLYSTFEEYEGAWVSTESILSSSDRKLQGLDYYINHSYVISSQVPFNKYKNIVKDIVHPAGYINYAEYLLRNTITSKSATVEVNSSIQFSANIEFITFNVYAGNTTIVTSNNINTYDVNVNDFYLVEFDSFNNVTISVSNTSILTVNNLITFDVGIPLTEIIFNENVQQFSSNITVPLQLFNDNIESFDVTANVLATSFDIFKNDVITYPVELGLADIGATSLSKTLFGNTYTYPINYSTNSSSVLYSTSINEFVNSVSYTDSAFFFKLNGTENEQFVSNISGQNSLLYSTQIEQFVDSFEGQSSLVYGTNNNIFIDRVDSTNSQFFFNLSSFENEEIISSVSGENSTLSTTNVQQLISSFQTEAFLVAGSNNNVFVNTIDGNAAFLYESSVPQTAIIENANVTLIFALEPIELPVNLSAIY